jgi:hypothetical protein
MKGDEHPHQELFMLSLDPAFISTKVDENNTRVS